MLNGIWTNKNAITNGPAANRGTYVGTIRTNGSSQVDCIMPTASATGGTAGVIGIWNAYNRSGWTAMSLDSTDSWIYATGSWRQSNNSATMQTSWITGIAGDTTTAVGNCWNTGSGNGRLGIGFDSVSSPSGITCAAVGQATSIVGTTALQMRAPIGWHYLSLLEYGTGSLTFYGDNGTFASSAIQSGLIVNGTF